MNQGSSEGRNLQRILSGELELRSIPGTCFNIPGVAKGGQDAIPKFPRFPDEAPSPG